MRVFFALIFCIFAISCADKNKKATSQSVDESKSSGSFTFDVSEPNVNISIPNIPNVEMKIHPMAGVYPNLRFIGTDESNSISIITPTADKGITAEECAIVLSNNQIEKYGLKQGRYQLNEAPDGNTFIMYFPLKIYGFLQMHVYLFSSHNGEHCIEVHVSRIFKFKKGMDEWATGFQQARIVSY